MMDAEPSRPMRRSPRSLVGPALLALAVLVSLFTVFRNQRAAEKPGKIVIRFLHWQLETGYRNAIDKAIADYERIKPNVHVVQMAVSDRVYDQFINTSLVSGSAPDVAEMGKGKFADLDQYVVRFYLPLGTYIRQPNPYNRGTPLADVPWQDTFLDGMLGGYKWDLQDYYRVAPGLSVRRYFYNKTLYRAATGTDVPPQTFGELMATGQKVRAWAKEHGRSVVPIVNAENQWGPWNRDRLAVYQIPFTSNLDDVVDVDLDGEIGKWESCLTYLRGDWSMKEPHLAAFHGMMADLSSLYEPGFMGMDRQTAMYRFVNEQALAIFTGSWDSASIAKQSEGRFAVGVFEFPLPAPSEKYGAYVRGRATESNEVGWSGFGIFRGSPHPEVALDFLQFLTSQPHNGPIMELASWPTIVRGSPTSEAMKAFALNPEGFSARLEIALAEWGNPGTVYFNEFARFLQGEETLDQLAAAFDAAARDPVYGAERVWAEEYARKRQYSRTQERLLSVQWLRGMLDPHATDAPAKYRRNLSQQVRDNVGEQYRYRFEQLLHKPIQRL
jgi:raffinose/stachyose/melibiose transport system substrate-binding protein